MGTPKVEDTTSFEEDKLMSMSTEDPPRATRLLDNEILLIKEDEQRRNLEREEKSNENQENICLFDEDMTKTRLRFNKKRIQILDIEIEFYNNEIRIIKEALERAKLECNFYEKKIEQLEMELNKQLLHLLGNSTVEP